jgi:hypothetical protein
LRRAIETIKGFDGRQRPVVQRDLVRERRAAQPRRDDGIEIPPVDLRRRAVGPLGDRLEAWNDHFRAVPLRQPHERIERPHRRRVRRVLPVEQLRADRFELLRVEALEIFPSEPAGHDEVALVRQGEIVDGDVHGRRRDRRLRIGDE